MARPRQGGRSLISRRAFLAGAAATPLAGVLAACAGSGAGSGRAVPDPVNFARTRWGNDPFARGSGSYLPIGATGADRAALAVPVDALLFFAGEATSSAHPATVRGAVESGRRAASELLASGPSRAARVVIIGAGAAGLAAAAELRVAGFEPVVLEARERVGGRVNTDTSLGVAIDLGASHVHDSGPTNPLTALARQGGIALVPAAQSSVLRDHSGRRRRDAARVSESLTKALARVGAGTQADAELAGALRTEAATGQLREPELTYAATALIEHALGAPTTEISWRSVDELGAAASRAGSVAALPRGGFASLLAPLADGVDIRLRTAVVRVDWSRARNRVVTASGEVPFDRLVVTVPLGVLQAGSPAFDPPLPVSKTTAIARLGTGTVDRLVLRFPEVFWDRDASWLGYLGTTPGEWVTWRNLFPSVGEPILVGTNGALVARTFDARTDEQLVASAMSALRAMYR